MIKIGIIGYGSRIANMFANVHAFAPEAVLAAVTDPAHDMVRARLAENGVDAGKVHFYDDVEQMLEREPLDAVMIGTRCSLHTTMAIPVLKRGLPLFLEKPVATTFDDLKRLDEAGQASDSPVVVSFPLRVTPLVDLARELIDSGRLGRIEHVQAFNDVPYGGVYFHSWYRDEAETGGLFLQKATHDFDYINALLRQRPVEIGAMKSKQIFRGDKPAGLRCADCPEAETCPEGPHAMKYIKHDDPHGDLCCFAVDTGNEDSGSALIRYESGLHVSYSQNFFARHQAARRGARLLGYDGSLEFDWYKDEIRVMMHSTPRVETYQVDGSTMDHGGGDMVLARNFVQVIRGKEPSVAPLESGILSAHMCLEATVSADTGTFRRIGPL